MLNLNDMYSVIPLYLPFKKNSFEIGPLIRPLILLYLITLKASLKQSDIYFFDFKEIFSNGFLKLYLIFRMLILSFSILFR